ncbi:MAG TPA: LytTR family DNA-binding domain-containing protein [Spongiibacteraceae bacterium]|nr:LytTR family DNA-binding domain-containing protein [Spongiibacteraceae bacterium]
MKVLIVDDEPLARARLRRQLASVPDASVVGEADNGEQALQACAALRPQVVLMDIRMPGTDGLSAALQLAQQPDAPAVIFCTAYDEYAIDAFETNAVAYLLKPVNQDKLALALARAERLSAMQLNALRAPLPTTQAHATQASATQAPATRSHISAKSRRGMELIALADVRYFIADQKYVTVYHRHGEVLIDDTLKELEDEFGVRLLRVHRNALVVLEHIVGLERIALGQYRIKLTDLEHGPQVSRRHLTEVRRALEQL